MKASFPLGTILVLTAALVHGGPRTSGDSAPRAPKPPEDSVLNFQFDTLSSTTKRSGGRTITLNRVSPPPLSKKVAQAQETLAEPALSDEQLARLFASLEEFEESRLCLISASAVRKPNARKAKASFIRWWHEGDEYSAWSNIDFNHLSGLHEFESYGARYSLIMGVGYVPPGEQEVPKKLPRLESTGPVYVLVDGDENNVEALGLMDALHDLYEAEEERLVEAYRLREENRRRHEKELKENPPKPEDVVIHYWPKKNSRKNQ